MWLATGPRSYLGKFGWIISQPLIVLITYYLAIPSFATRLDVSTLLPLDPKDIRTTYFEVKNVGSFPTQDVYFTCVWNDVRFENNVKIQRSRTSSGRIDVGALKPNQAETTLCLDRHAIDVGAALSFADIQLEVSYRPCLPYWTNGSCIPLHREIVMFRFTTVQSSDATLVWHRHPPIETQ